MTDESMAERTRKAFKHARTAPFRAALEYCPDSFLLSDTGQGYASPHVQRAYQQFTSGYLAALSAQGTKA